MASEEEPVRFGAEFGPQSISGRTSGVSLSTFKSLVWTSNIGGLLLVVFGLELIIVSSMPGWGLFLIVLGTIVALFPSNFEIIGMQDPAEEDTLKDDGPEVAE